MATARYSQTATLLPDGNVLIAGGSDDFDLFTTLASVELYDPEAGRWTSTSGLGTPRIFHEATLLPSGKILASGGYAREGGPPTTLLSAVLYDSASRTWADTGRLNEARESHTATLLRGGQVLVVGGSDWNLHQTVKSAELYDLSTGSFTRTADLNTARENHSATLLSNGKVLVAGGSNSNGILGSVEIYDPGTVPNAIDNAQFFVLQHYLDFLNREADPPGLAGWLAVLNNCVPGSTSCDRVHVSGAFFQSQEFEGRGYFAYRQYSVAFGRKPDFAEFMPDLQRVSGFLSDAQLEAAKVALIADFMTRPAFINKYNGLDNSTYVETLISTAAVTLPNRQALIDALNALTKTRAQVFREIVESNEVYQKYYNQSFVVMQYFGYLRRDPDALYLGWIRVLDTTGNSRTLINGFVNSSEYRARFGS
ncbi:MAG: kelch repeat-containing protein [bacterium]